MPRVVENVLFLVVGDTDIMAVAFTLPYILNLPQTVAITHTLRIKTGASAAPIVGRDFISAVFLSRDPVFDWSDMRIGSVPNEIGTLHLKARLHVPAMSSFL